MLNEEPHFVGRVGSHNSATVAAPASGEPLLQRCFEVPEVGGEIFRLDNDLRIPRTVTLELAAAFGTAGAILKDQEIWGAEPDSRGKVSCGAVEWKIDKILPRDVEQLVEMIIGAQSADQMEAFDDLATNPLIWLGQNGAELQVVQFLRTSFRPREAALFQDFPAGYENSQQDLGLNRSEKIRLRKTLRIEACHGATSS